MEGGKLDCGKIVGQKEFILKEENTITDIYTWSEKIIPELFVEVLEKLQVDESFCIRYADPEGPGSFRCYPRLPEDGFIDWHKVLDQILADIENRKLTAYKAYLAFSFDFFDKSTLRYSTSGVNWTAVSDDFQLKYEDKIPSIEYKELDLFGSRKEDSIGIYGTSGPEAARLYRNLHQGQLFFLAH